MEEHNPILGGYSPTHPPSGEVLIEGVQQLYSPKQVQMGSFLGGPLAATYYLWKNFTTLENSIGAKCTLCFGIGFCILLVALIPWFPERTPSYLIPLAYSWFAYHLVGKHQRSKEQIQNTPGLGFHSNWKVTWIALAGLIAFAAPAFGFGYLVEYRKLPPHEMVKVEQLSSALERLEQKKQEKSFVIFAFPAPDAKSGEDDVNLQFRIENGITTLVWVLVSQRNIADKERIRHFAEQQGISLLEVQEPDAKLLYSQDTRVKDLGTKILRDFYRLSPSTKVMAVEGQD